MNNLFSMRFDRNLEPGTYTAIVTGVNFVDSKIIHSNDCDKTDTVTKPYIAVELLIDGLHVTERWYESRLRYICYALRSQFGMLDRACTVEEILSVARAEHFYVTVSYHTQYGRQIDYKKGGD